MTNYKLYYDEAMKKMRSENPYSIMCSFAEIRRNGLFCDATCNECYLNTLKWLQEDVDCSIDNIDWGSVQTGTKFFVSDDANLINAEKMSYFGMYEDKPFFIRDKCATRLTVQTYRYCRKFTD